MKRKIYVASSWQNPLQPSLVTELRRRGHEVYDFRHPQGRNDRNVWEEINVKQEAMYGENLIDALEHPLAQERFEEHHEAMCEADTCVLLLPAGNSAHIEAGYMKGLGKKVYVLGSVFDEVKPELMYLTFDNFFCLYENLFDALDEVDDE